MWLGTSSSSSSLSPLPSSHLHRIHKLYEYPEYDLPIASSSKIASTPSGPSSSGNAVTEDGSSVEEGLQSLSIRHGREESSKSASPALMQRKVTPEQAKAFYPVSYGKLSLIFTTQITIFLTGSFTVMTEFLQSAANGCKNY